MAVSKRGQPMKLIIGGSIAIVLSIFGFAYSFPEFLKFMAGIVPVSLLLGGCVALYIYREMRCEENCEQDTAETCCTSGRPEGGAGAVSTDPEPWKPGSSASVKEAAVDEKPAEEQTQAASADPDPEPSAPEESPAQPSEETKPATDDAPEQETSEAAEEPHAAEAEEKEADEPAVIEDETPAQQDKTFVGNEESRVFHKASCQYAKSKKCTASFATRDEAVAEGYKACGVCKP